MSDIIYENDFIKMVWNDTRLDLLDSDGNYFNYLFDACFYDEDEQVVAINSTIQKLDNIEDDTELVKLLKDMFFEDVLKVEMYCGYEQEIKDLKEQYGDEYVNRFGRHCLIMSE